MLPPTVLENVCRYYHLEPDLLRPLGYSQNEVFEESGQAVILRISHGRCRTALEIEAELSWIRSLAAQHVSVCVPILSASGHWVETIIHAGGEYLAVCFQKAPGRKITQADLSPRFYRQLGRLTAQLHQNSFEAQDSDHQQSYFTRSHWTESRLLTSDLEQFVSPNHASFRSTVEQLIIELQTESSEPLGLIHADISVSNIFLEGDQLWIFDFDNCEVGTVTQDLATILYDSIYCRAVHQMPAAEQEAWIQRSWSALLSGYREIRAIASISPERLKKYVLLREAVIYIHYCRLYPAEKMSPTWQAGLQEMQQNVASRTLSFCLPRS